MKLFPLYVVDVIREGKKEHLETIDEKQAIEMVKYWLPENDVIEINIRGRLARRDDEKN